MKTNDVNSQPKLPEWLITLMKLYDEKLIKVREDIGFLSKSNPLESEKYEDLFWFLTFLEINRKCFDDTLCPVVRMGVSEWILSGGTIKPKHRQQSLKFQILSLIKVLSNFSDSSFDEGKRELNNLLKQVE